MARKLTYEDEFYFPSNLISLMKLSDTQSPEMREAAIRAQKTIRKEYTKLRDISQKRLKRMGQSEFARSQTYMMNVGHFPKLADIKTPQELAYRLSELSRFIESPMSTITGQKTAMQKAIATLHSSVDKYGAPKEAFTFVNEDNYLDFAEFMQEWRDQHLDEIYDSGEAAETFSVLEKHEITADQVREDFEYWLENRDTADKLRKMESYKNDPEALKKANERYKKRKKSSLKDYAERI